MRINTLNADDLDRAANMLKAIAHPMRIAILDLLDENEIMTVSQIHQRLNIEQSTTSHHLGILKDKGIVISKRDGKNTYYSLKNQNFAKIIECMSNCPFS